MNASEKKRILFCCEATYLNTGYATYAREILKRLHSTNKYEIAEFASYGQESDPRMKGVSWKFYANQPNEDDEVGFSTRFCMRHKRFLDDRQSRKVSV